MMAFGCGPDSMMMNLVQMKAHAEAVPFMSLTIEEHTAEAGILTRIEAFLDMIHERRRIAGKNDRYVSAHR
jgi:predicted nucleotide-binding protein (sugar kinase/HSP70/actin superfamily)